ncbi:hypothetical protein JST99_00130 [Candidatus Dependentiae bacterium]|nr:hypothetical protein [Candidatus Dependentiae bacterium]
MNSRVKSTAVGFMLLETMLSIFMLIVVSLLSMSYAVDLSMRMTQLLTAQQNDAQLAMVLDLIADDLACAPAHTTWKRATEQETIWTTAYGDVGFENRNKGIVRSKGTFDHAAQRWVERTRSYLPLGIWYRIDGARDDSAHISLVDLTVWTADRRQAATTITVRSGAQV